MRVLVLDTYYPPFLAEHYGARPGLAERPYDEQLGSLLGRAFGTADAYSRYLAASGHEASDVIVNCAPLQCRWAREHGGIAGRIAGAVSVVPGVIGRRAEATALRRIAMRQVAVFEPEVVYCQNMTFFSRAELDVMRGQGCLVVGQIASAPPRKDIVEGFDLILTSFPHYVQQFRDLGVDSEFLAIAFYDRVLDQLRRHGIEPAPGAQRPHDVAFVGGVDPAVHGAGVRMLEQLVGELPLELWGYGAGRLRRDSPIRTRHNGEAWGLDMYAVLARSRIAINRHIAAAEGHANNMRLFEATGVGALLLTEASANLDALFEPGREVVTYADREDLVEKVHHYLAHDDERREIAQAGQVRTLADHTYERRIAELEAILTARL